MSLQECTTADDVRKLARRTLERRRAMMTPKPPERPIAIPIREVLEQATPIPIRREVTVPEPVIVADPVVLLEPVHICPSLAIIMDVVCRHYEVTPLDIRSDRRTRNVILPRQIVMYLARHMTTQSYPWIGMKLGGRDHTTVLHGAEKIKGLRIDNALLDETLRQLEKKITALAAVAIAE
jgi:hypothetical protein